MAIADDPQSSPGSPDPVDLPELPGAAGKAPPADNPKPPSLNVSPEFTGPGTPTSQAVSATVEPSEPPELPELSEPQPSDTPSPEGSDLFLGRMFGGYELVQKIGQGGMGLVYKGRQVSLDRVVAVKILNKALCDNDEFIKRFEREAKSIARINHPNIMAVYDFGKTEGMWFMVTEFVEGSSLSKQIAEQLMLSPQELAPLMIQCLAGLAHVGLSGIVHRDIKPDNILITKDGIAKIADFGLAKDVSAEDNTDLTAVGLAMGTPAYMSPEQCMGRKLDGRSDIYSLGVSAYLALTGEKPFTGQSSFEIMTKQREFTPPPPQKLNPSIPREVSDLVMHMLAKSQHQRFKDAEECRQAWVDVMQQLDSQPAVALSPSADPALLANTERLKAKRPGTEPPAAVPAALPATPLPATAVDPLVPSLPAVPSAPEAVPKSSVFTRGGAESVHQGGGEAAKQFYRTDDHPAAQDGEVAGKVASDRMPRPITERRAQRSSAVTEAITCPRCGMLNRKDQSVCSRCANELRESSHDPTAIRDQEAEAQRLIGAGSFRDAANIYARLADRETDRRARAIFRSKEREARTQEHQLQVEEIQNRTKSLVQQGNIQGGLEMLQRGLREVREVGASGAGAEDRLLKEMGTLRLRLRRRQRRRMVLLVVALVTIIVGAVLIRVYIFPPASAGPASGSTVIPPPPVKR